MSFRSLPDMLRAVSTKYKDKAAQMYKEDGEWKEITYGELGRNVRLRCDPQ